MTKLLVFLDEADAITNQSKKNLAAALLIYHSGDLMDNIVFARKQISLPQKLPVQNFTLTHQAGIRLQSIIGSLNNF